MRILERNTRAELRAAADSLEALLESGTPDHQDMRALVSQMRSWAGEVLSGIACPPVPVPATVH